MGKSNRVDSVNLVYNDLKNKIISKEKAPNDKLPELQLCEQYGVSRLHIKEALKMLEMENLVRYIPRRG
jgi:DNA-binding GntR family transcriptional regulator